MKVKGTNLGNACNIERDAGVRSVVAFRVMPAKYTYLLSSSLLWIRFGHTEAPRYLISPITCSSLDLS